MSVPRRSKAISLLYLTLSAIVSCPLSVSGDGASERVLPATCTYDMQVWNVKMRSSSPVRKVRHAYNELIPAETDAATGCTVCSEDQVEIVVPPLEPFHACHRLESRVRSLVADLIKMGAPIRTIIGYHPIRSRGPVDGNGNRTEFSNHSFGTAVDINPEQNGLYENCVTFGPLCRLLRGGEWHPGAVGALTRDSIIVRSFKAAGFKWGGEIQGEQKDFMHFSPTGY